MDRCQTIGGFMQVTAELNQTQVLCRIIHVLIVGSLRQGNLYHRTHSAHAGMVRDRPPAFTGSRSDNYQSILKL